MYQEDGESMDYDTAFERGTTFPEFLEETRANRELWQAYAARAPLDEEAAERIRNVGGRFRFLVLTDDWCGDAVNTVPVVARLADAAPNVELRIVPRDAFPELRDRHLTNGSRSIPVVVLLDEHGAPQGAWGPRPDPLQAWFQEDLRTMPKDERYREIRKWYARDRGATTAREIADLVEAGAATTAGEGTRRCA